MSAEPFCVEIRTGARLHFGLLETCTSEPHCFGGLGIALPQPGFRLAITAANSRPGSVGQVSILHESPEIRQRVAQVVSRRQRLLGDVSVPATVEIHEAIPLHSGLGAGTQLACAVAFGLEIFYQQAQQQAGHPRIWQHVADAIGHISPNPQQWISHLAGRGKRSAIGMQSFLTGGCIFDKGYQPCLAQVPNHATDVNVEPSRLIEAETLRLPTDWRVIRILANAQESMAGPREETHIAATGELPNPNSDKMLELAEGIGANLRSGEDFDSFVQALDEYMQLAAAIFQVAQGGLYNGSHILEVVETSRAAGLFAVGQSSWGPTVFGFVPNEAAGIEVCNRLKSKAPTRPLEIQMHRVDFNGAQYRVCGIESAASEIRAE